MAVSGEQLLNIPVASNHGTKPLAYAVADSGLAYPSSTGGTTTSIRGISTVDYL